MALSKHCKHRHCEHPVFPCQGCGATVLQCKAGVHNGNGWCCEGCLHTRPKTGTEAAA